MTEFDKANPGLVMVQMRRIGVDRRQATKAAIESDDGKPDFGSVISRYERFIRDVRTPTRLASFYAIKFARFQSRVSPDLVTISVSASVIVVSVDVRIMCVLDTQRSQAGQKDTRRRP